MLLSRVSPYRFFTVFFLFSFPRIREYRLWMHFLHTLSPLSMVPFPLLISLIKLLVASPKPKVLLIGPISYAQRRQTSGISSQQGKEDTLLKQQRHVIKEETEIDDDSHYSYFYEGEEKAFGDIGISSHRPLYRQSSMDFIKPSVTEIRENRNIARSVSAYPVRPLFFNHPPGTRISLTLL